ncbi:unnamed protein product [Rodentolepis nana]|uniref:Cilia- and flagella-associated protein 43 n=1 Tax=Rodentolepis nana TaxID=102285 RepID=A0A158QHF7_RODNA|nr:unnamed protein product [Rodentolepis nana]
MLDESEDEILKKVSSIFSQNKSIFNFGSCAERKTFFEQTVPSRFGITQHRSSANPNLGPGTYTNDYKSIDFDLRSSCNKKTGWSTTKRDFYKLNNTPGPASYQIDSSSNGIVKQNRYPFNIKCPRTLPYNIQGKDSPSETTTPRTDAQIGIYEEPNNGTPLDLIYPEENPNIYPTTKEANIGSFKNSYEEYQNYKDNAKRMKPVSLTWTKEGFAIFGCRDGEVFMIDLESMVLGIISNPFSNNIHKEDEVIRVMTVGNVDTVLYTNGGLLCGGGDGHLRLLDWTQTESETSKSLEIDAAVSRITQNIPPIFVRKINSIAQSKMVLLNEELLHNLKSDLRGIAFMSPTPDYNNLAILRNSGLVQILRRQNTALKLLKTINSNISAFVGICSIDIEEISYFVTCNSGGQVSLWLTESGKQICSMEFSSAGTCIKAIPGLPLTAIGFEDGSLSMIFWEDRQKPYIIQTIQIFQSAIKEIYMDRKGDLMLIKGSETKLYIVPCEPSRKFQPVGYIAHEKEIDSVTFAGSANGNIHCLILDKQQKPDNFTMATYFILTDRILNDATSYLLPNTYQLRDDSISQFSLKILLEISDAYLSVIESKSTDSDSNDPISENKEFDPESQFILYALTKDSSFNYNLVTINLTKEIIGQTSTNRIRSKSGLLNRWSSLSSQNSGRRLPAVSTVTNARFRSTRHSVNFLRLTQKRKEEKERVKRAIPELADYQTTSVSFVSSSMSLLSTHIPGYVIVTSQSGIAYILNLNDSAKMLTKHFPLTEYTDLPIQVAVTMDFSTIAAIKSDGSICAINLADKMPQMEDFEFSVIKNEFATKLHQFKKTNAFLITNSQSETSIIDDDLKIIKVIRKSNAVTWLEKQFQNQQAIDEELFADTKSHVLKEFKQIKKELETMAEKNNLLTDLEKIALTEFELDSEERNAKREEIEQNNLIKDFTHNALKSCCWETQEVKGRSILAYNSPIEVSNYPIHSRTEEEVRILDQAKLRRKIEMKVGVLYRRECDKTLKTEGEKDGSEDISKEDTNSENTDPHIGSVAAKFGVSTDLLYNQMELYTNDQKITQAILIQEEIRQLKLKFNKEFDECLKRKRQHIEEIMKRVANINQIIPKLDPTAPLLSLDQYKLRPTESPENLLECTDEEVDVERYRSPEEIAAMEEARRAEEERLRREQLDNWRERGLDDMMGGVLEVTKEDELRKDIPVPSFVEAGKKESDMTLEELTIYRNYLQACKKLEEERARYRKSLETEIKKNETAIEEIKSTVDEEVINLFKSYIKYEVALKMEEIQVWKLKASVLQARELQDEEKYYGQRKDDLKQRIEKLHNIIQTTKNLIEGLQENMELINVEDHMLEKNFRKDFHDVHGQLYDILLKAFRRRPKNLDIQLGDEVNEMGKTISSPESAYPYKQAVIQNRSLEAEWAAMQRALNEFDEANKLPEYNISPAIWNRLYKARMKKASKEMELKMTDYKLEIAKDFLQRIEQEIEDAVAELNEIEKALSELKLKTYKAMTNVVISIIMPQGQDEVCVEPGALVEDFNSCLFINRKQIEDLNVRVVQLSNEKIDHMELIKAYKRRFKMLEWDLREMLMRYEDLLEKQKEITNFTISREIQRYLRSSNYDSMIAEEMKDSERTYAQLKVNHNKNMAKIEEKIRYYSEKQAKKIKKENEKLVLDLEQMNVDVNRVRSIYEQTPHATGDVLRAEICYKSLLRKVNLETLTQLQKSELETLCEELEQLRGSVSPSIQDQF